MLNNLLEKIKTHKKIVIGGSIAAVAAVFLLFTFTQLKAMAKTTDQVEQISAEVDALYSDETHAMLADTATMEQVVAIEEDVDALNSNENHTEESAKALEETTTELNNAKLMVDLRDSANALFKEGILIQGSDIAAVEAKATELNEIKPDFVASIMPTINEAKNQQTLINNATKLVNSLFTAEDRKVIREDVTREEYQAAADAVALIKDPAIKEQLQASLKVVNDDLTKKEAEAEAAAVAAAEAEAKKKAAETEAKKANSNDDDAMGSGNGESGNNNGGGTADGSGHPGNSGTDIYDVPTWTYYKNYSVLVEEDGHMYGDGAPVYRVIDVSSWQGEIDWAAVEASGVDGVIIRATSYSGDNGIHEDDYFWENYQGAKAVGLPVGVYVYAEAGTPEEAKAEAEELLRILNSHNIKPGDLELGVWYDIEDSTQDKLSPSQIEDLAQVFFGTIEAKGFTNNGIYSGKSFTDNNLTTPYLESKVGWVARYNDIFRYDYSSSNAKYLGWQYTSTSTVPGVKGDCDVNGFYKNPSPNLLSVSPSSTEEELIFYPTKWENVSKHSV